MLGTIIGDIVGSIYERRGIKTKDFELFGRGCSFTDDTVMSIAVAEALLDDKDGKGKFSDSIVKSLQQWGRKYPYAGYGGNFILWIDSDDPKPYNSFGNGSAMRVVSCGFISEDITEALSYAKESAEVTHNHPEGIKGAEIVSMAIFLAKNKKSKQEIKTILEKQFGLSLDKTLDQIRPSYQFDVTCQGTVPQALQAFLESTCFEDAIRNAISLGGDSDTLAAITGGIAEAYYGIPDDIRNKAMEYLDEDIKGVVKRYYSYLNKTNQRNTNETSNPPKKEKLSERELKEIKLDSVLGCLFGGAYGDALGYPVEFMKKYQIEDEYGEEGITELRLKNGKAQISDDTQMTLYTANGMLVGQTRAFNRGISGLLSGYVYMAYKEWYERQVGSFNSNENKWRMCWLNNNKALGESRAPGNSCLSAIANSTGNGTTDNPVNDSKGCGGVMRVAPVACFAVSGHLNGGDTAAIEAANIAALTHGHPLGYITAAYMSDLIYCIITYKITNSNIDLFKLATESIERVEKLYGSKSYFGEFKDITQKAINMAQNNEADDAQAIKILGEGWVAEEALAIGLYCALRYCNNFRKAICVAVNHDGDSDSTGSIAGNILGAYVGLSGVDFTGDTLVNIEAYDVVYEIGQDLVEGCKMTEYGNYNDVKWASKYITATYGK